MALSPIKLRESAVQACARVLRHAVLSGEFATGSRLPAERQLSETLGVNRLTLRGALATLTDSGLLTVRHGSGYFVNDYGLTGGPRLLPGLIELAREQGRTQTLLEELLLIFSHLARAVFVRLSRADADTVDTTEITAAIERARPLFEDETTPLDQLARADFEVQRALVQASGSIVLQLCMNPVLAAVMNAPGMREVMLRDRQRVLAVYQLILAWLETRDPASIDGFMTALERGFQALTSEISETALD